MIYADLCYANKQVNYKAMKDAGVGIAYAKIGQVGIGVDPMFKSHRAGLIDAGILLGIYYFSDYRKTALQNAGACAEYLDLMGYTGDNMPIPPLMLDVEYEERLGWGRPSPASMLVFALNLYAELETTLARDMTGDLIYSNPDMFIPWVGQPGVEEMTLHPLAVAHWGVQTPLVKPWPEWTIWQNQGDVTVPWADQPVDLGVVRNEAVAAWPNVWQPGVVPLRPPVEFPGPGGPVVTLASRDECIDDLLKRNGYKWIS